jgi:hypothetical protein
MEVLLVAVRLAVGRLLLYSDGKSLISASLGPGVGLGLGLGLGLQSQQTQQLT